MLAASLLLGACEVSGRSTRPTAASAAQLNRRVDALADTVLTALFDHFADWGTYFGVPNARHDRLPDNSLAELRRWRAREDAWLATLRAIDPRDLAGRPAWVTYGMLREGVESSVATRTCNTELWKVDQLGGWQATLAYLADAQPVGTDSLRSAALQRWSGLPAYIDSEIENLREGVRLGYTAPRGNVRLVIGQLDELIGTPTDRSPFFAPALHDSTPAFRSAFASLVRDRITPALRRYRDYLDHEYLSSARTTIALAAVPQGAECYRALVRSYTTLDIAPDSVFSLGQQRVAAIDAEMRDIARRTFGTSDVPALLHRLQTDTAYTFRSRDAILAFARDAIARADAAAPRWFRRLPKAGVTVEPYPEFLEATSVAEYKAPAEDGSRGGTFLLSTYEPRKRSRFNLQAIVFHEAIPGHHVATAVALEGRDGRHAITRYLNNSGFVEGWAVYSERLADEIGLYSSDVDRFGMLTEQAFRAARLVVDPGIHVKRWTREAALDYLVAHSALSRDEAAAEIDRYIIMPGQAPAYMLGMLELQSLRRDATQRLGDRFDIGKFHDAVLEDGAVTLPMLRAKIASWSPR